MVESVVTFMLTVTEYWCREIIAKKLRSGGAFAQKLSNIVEKELCKMQRRLKALTRKDLVESIDLFLEGFALDSLQADDNEGDAGPLKPKTWGMDPKTFSDQTDAVTKRIVENSVSDEAKKRFEDARKKAGSAIANEAMKTEEVILATLFKVSSQILETDDLATAFKFCLHYLQRLHSREDVIKNFKDEFHYIENRGKLSVPPVYGCANARKIIWCVCCLNRFVFEIAKETGESKRSPRLFKAWPSVQIEQQIEIDPLRDPRLFHIFKLENLTFPITPSLFDQNDAGKESRPQSLSGRAETTKGAEYIDEEASPSRSTHETSPPPWHRTSNPIRNLFGGNEESNQGHLTRI